jgi:RNA polymerase sigma factor (sigma-70 family)
MTESQTLLVDYAGSGSETAFRELVSRYIDFVYSTAFRLVDGNSQLAEDVTQLVFISLAKQARSLSSGVMVGGWLHQRTFHLATKAARGERRRRIREREAAEMNILHKDAKTEWHDVAPLLDKAITRLNAADRAAILLRFFEQRDFRSVGKEMGTHEDAARMRVNRALEKLHAMLKAEGASLSATALGTVLTAHAVTAAPAGLAAATAGVALGSAGTVTGMALLQIMATTKLKGALVGALIAGLVATAIVQQRAGVSLRHQNTLLQTQLARLQADNEQLARNAFRRSRAPRLPAPEIAATAPTVAPAEVILPAGLYSMVTNKSKLSAAQLQSYLETNGRNAASLLAGFRTSGDAALLEEAMKKFPGDPQVAFEAAMRKDIAPEERRQWLDALKQAAGDDAFARYLSAADHFKHGASDKALEDMMAASGLRQFHDHTLDRILADDEAYRAAGYSVAEARIAATSHLLLPQLIEFRDLSQQMVNLAQSYGQAGDESSRRAALEMVAEMGRRYSDGAPGETLISQMVGIAVERRALGAMDPGSPYEDGMIVQQRLDHLVSQKTAVLELGRRTEGLWDRMSDQDWISYYSRSVAQGEMAALRWLAARYGPNTQ